MTVPENIFILRKSRDYFKEHRTTGIVFTIFDGFLRKLVFMNDAVLIDVEELRLILGKEDLVLVDASNHGAARSNYEKLHISGAIFVDANTQLADIQDNVSIGGRHPLPHIEDFLMTLSEIGISPEDHVVIYDDKFGTSAAARFWWMLKSVGHQNVQVLNGGFAAALDKNLPLSSGNETRTKSRVKYHFKSWQWPIVDIDEVQWAVSDPSSLIIDVREEKRFLGEIEPIDLVAGHIPNAKNFPFSENLDDYGYFHSREELVSKYNQFFGVYSAKNTIIHCGSGVTACHSILAMAHAGFDLPKLYVGSWSEWSRNGKTMITKSL
jgi:thiosulfate/3-mercaptopyruvate sulfurtransferase